MTNFNVLSIMNVVLYMYYIDMDMIDALNDAMDRELMETREELNSLYNEIEEKRGWWVKEWVKHEVLSNGTEKTITYRNWKKDWPYIEEWKWVYKRQWQYKGDFRVWRWVETRKNWSKIEGEYDDFGCQNGKWIKTDAEGNIVKQWEYEHWALKNGTRVEFSF